MKPRRKPVKLHDWLYAGLLRFAEGGERNLQVERLADQLGVTKGSYYYYFTSREDFIRQMLDYSLQITTEAFIEHASAEDGARKQLRSLTISVLKSRTGKDFDFYLRDFARRSEHAARMVQRIDQRRMAYIRELLIGCGLKPERAAGHAEIYYTYYLGWYARNKDRKLTRAELQRQLGLISDLLGVELRDA